MKIISIGSKFFDDAIIRIKSNVINVARITDVSPFVFSYNYKNDFDLNDCTIKREQNYINLLALLDVTGEVWKTEQECDAVILDVLDMRVHFNELTLRNGKKVRLSENSKKVYEEEIFKEILQDEWDVVASRKVNPLLLSDGELENEIILYAEWIKSKYESKKIFLLKNKIATQCIDETNNVNFVPNYESLYGLNEFYEKCTEILSRHLDVQIIDAPRFNIADLRNEIYNLFVSNYSYYKYFVSAVQNPDNISQYKENFEDEIYDMINNFSIHKCANEISKNYQNRKVIFIGKSELMRQLLLKQYGIEVSNVIEYFPWTSDETIKHELAQRINTEDFYFVVNRLYNKTEVLNVLKYNALQEKKNYLVVKPTKVTYENFVGKIVDTLNNELECSVPTNIEITGWANTVESGATTNIEISVDSCNYVKIGASVRSNLNKCLVIKCENGTTVSIGDRTRFINGDRIQAASFSNIEIGNDCLFSSEILVKTLGRKELVKQKENAIHIADAVWIGYRVSIMSGVRIEEGSVCGARTTLYNTHIPNNCIVVGEPGVVIRKDIAWDADALKHNIMECNSEHITVTRDT